ncbi:hypothetical protein [Fuerstiella marisgermanici]|nr:hypothetical protein [Fuerstiella marisgermanici]
MLSEAETETGFVCLFPITVKGMIFDESVTLEHTWRETPMGFCPSLRQIKEWTAQIRRENDEAERQARERWERNRPRTKGEVLAELVDEMSGCVGEDEDW